MSDHIEHACKRCGSLLHVDCSLVPPADVPAACSTCGRARGDSPYCSNPFHLTADVPAATPIHVHDLTGDCPSCGARPCCGNGAIRNDASRLRATPIQTPDEPFTWSIGDLRAATDLSYKLMNGKIHPAECDALSGDPLSATYDREKCACGMREVADEFHRLLVIARRCKINHRHTTATPAAVQVESALDLAIRFHQAYERLAPRFGYTTRPETRAFDAESPNGQLMVAVCTELLPALRATAAPSPTEEKS